MMVLEKKQREKVRTIPAYLAYEEIDGEAIPYKGYREVLAGNKKPEEIMGSSSIQAAIVYAIGLFVGTRIDRKKYLIVSNEAGLHLRLGNNLANDIAIFDRSKTKLNNKYFRTAPKTVIEVDSKADLSDTSFDNEMAYFVGKSQKMLDFGVEKVVWVFTSSRKIMISEAGQDWRFANFDRDIPLLDDCILNVAKLLAEEKIEF